MRNETFILARPVKLEELETRFKTAVGDVRNFFAGSCCIDTQPPLPPGA